MSAFMRVDPSETSRAAPRGSGADAALIAGEAEKVKQTAGFMSGKIVPQPFPLSRAALLCQLAPVEELDREGRPMGLDAAMFFATFVTLFPVGLASLAIIKAGRHFRIVPRGLPSVAAFLLICCAIFSAIYLFNAAERLLVAPARLQRQYLGGVFAGPLALRRYEHTDTIMDQDDQWEYVLSAEAFATLRRRCRPEYDSFTRRTRCSLFRGMDDRWYADVWLEKDRLRMDEGLW